MNIKKIRIILFVLFLCFSFLLQQNQINPYKNNNNYRTILPLTSDVFNFEWNITWGGSRSEGGKGIVIDGSGNAFITGGTDRYGYYSDVFLLKYDSDGNLLWNTTWGGYHSDQGCGIALDDSGNILITGNTYSYGAGSSEVFLLNYDSEGNLQWSKTWGGSGSDDGNGIAIDSLGNTYIVGSTRSFGVGNNDVLILKFDSEGNLQWNKTWGGFLYDYGEGIVVDSLGNVFITGVTCSYEDDSGDVFLLKYNSEGNLLSSKTWGNFLYDGGEGLSLDNFGNIFITGYTEDFISGGFDTFLLKYDSGGNLLWDKTWGSSSWDFGEGIVIDGLGNLFITGHTYGSLFLLNYDLEGNLQWTKTRKGSYSDDGEGISLDIFGNIFITGCIINSNPVHTTDAFLLKYQADTDEDGLSNEIEIKIYGTDPNDFDSDDDGLSDGDEVNAYLTDPNDSDSDDDGLSDGDEVNVYLTDPNDSDSDDDGLSDGDEVHLGTDPQNFFDNSFSRVIIDIIIIISIAILILVSFIVIRKKKVKQVNVIIEKGDILKEKSYIDKSGEYYQKALLKTNGIFNFVPKSMKTTIKAKFDEILNIQINHLIDGGVKLKKIKYFDESINNFYTALSKVNKISDKELKEKFQSILKDYINTTKIIKIKSIFLNLGRN